jgi:hypothetical protein
MKRNLLVVLVIAGLLGSAVSAWAHHSFAATYDGSKKIQIEGSVVQVQFRNPHSWVYVSAPDETGARHKWAIEWRGAAQLGGQGVSRETFKVGDVVAISGNPGRNPEDHRIRMITIHRKSDGFGWGTAPGEVVD